MQKSPEQAPSEGVYVDTRATYLLTFISLAIGVVIASIVGLIIFSLRQPLIADEQGRAAFSIGVIMVPLAAIAAVAILAWAVFQLPVWFAKRQGIILDPDVWPWTGAIGVGVVAVIGFVGAIVYIFVGPSSAILPSLGTAVLAALVVVLMYVPRSAKEYFRA